MFGVKVQEGKSEMEANDPLWWAPRKEKIRFCLSAKALVTDL